MRLNAIIIDDEPLARARIANLAASVPDLTIIGEAGNGREALELIQKTRPDLAFLDIQMPEMNGFELLAELPEPIRPLVVFTTAFNEHAIQAFETEGVDYLLKPFKKERLVAAVERARERLEGIKARELIAPPKELEPNQENNAPISRLTIRDNDQTRVLKIREIEAFESAGNYVVAHTQGQQFILRETLSALERQLPPRAFLRISRSALAQIDCITALEPGVKNEPFVRLESGLSLQATRSLRDLEKALRGS